MVDCIKSIFYGIVQGLTEFLPVSSSGHLALFQAMFGTVCEGFSEMTYTLFLHLGTLAAVLLVYRKDVAELFAALVSVAVKLFTGKLKYKELKDNEKLFCLLFLSLVPLLAGAVIEGAVEFVTSYTVAVGIFWIVNGIIFLISEAVTSGIKKKNFNEITVKNAFSVGLFQLFATLPGISRSGMTITGGLFNGFKREFAVKYSFILSIPAIVGSVAVTLIKDFNEISVGSNMSVLISGVVASFVSGLLAIKLLEYISKKHTFKVFAYYCIALGAIVVLGNILKAVIGG